MKTKEEQKRIAQVFAAQFPSRAGWLGMDSLYGPSGKKGRQAVMSAIAGAKVPAGACGWNAFRSAMVEAFGIERDCLAIQERNLNAAIKAALES